MVCYNGSRSKRSGDSSGNRIERERERASGKLVIVISDQLLQFFLFFVFVFGGFGLCILLPNPMMLYTVIDIVSNLLLITICILWDSVFLSLI